MAAGRPRAFDADKALDRAMHVFWRKGYEGASLAELTQAMGINPPSLYSCYGNKEGLFRQVIERYMHGPAKFMSEALEAPTARGVAEQFLRGALDLNTNADYPGGCLMIQAALVAGEDDQAIRGALAQRREAGVAAMRRRFQRAKAEGDLPPGADPAQLARYLAAVIRGMAVEAAGGASKKELKSVADMALAHWPTAKK